MLGLVAGREPISLADLVQREHINPTMLSRVVGELDAAGLIVRSPDPSDLRSVSLTATEAGHATHQRIRAQRAAAVSRSAESLSARDQQSIVAALAALERLVEHIE